MSVAADPARPGLGALSALIDFSNPLDPAAPRLRHAFGAPLLHLQADTLDAVRGVLDAVEAHAQAGRWCVGYVAFEAAPAFDPALVVHATCGPLVWFAVYDQALPWPESPLEGGAPAEASIDWQPLMPRADFDAAIATLHQAIGAGEMYQVNFTTQMRGTLEAATGESQPQPRSETQSQSQTNSQAQAQAQTALALFAALQRAQPGGYAAYLDTGAHGQVLSVSPELFFDWRAGHLLARPMKGTARRGHSPQEDDALAQGLRSSPKERSENVMIVDLLRNDMSRVAQPFSVQVPRLFHTEALPTVWQMTSDVQARTRAGTSLYAVFEALFPCGSVTGAPKVQAMHMIRQLEPQARGLYCGALGVVQPGGAATFNVPIRTLTLQGAQARCGIGSGITFDAQADGEWQEWAYKQAFVQRASQAFSLLETLALEDGTFRHLAQHLARMQAAAAHFGTPWHAQRLHDCLHATTRAHPGGLWRVRLLLDARGAFQAQAFALPPSPARVRLQLADRPLQEAHSEFVRFKTTRRAHYDAFTPTDPAVFDTVLWNPQGEITECTRGNVAFLLDGRWVTPPLACGLLDGVGRAQALASGRGVEAVVRLDDVPRVAEVAFMNSLRGWLAGDWHLPSPAP